MIGKMILQGLAAAALIAGGAGVYAANAQDGPQAAPVDKGYVQTEGTAVDNGYLAPVRGWFGERRRDGHHDDDGHRRREVRGDDRADNGYRAWKGKRHDD